MKKLAVFLMLSLFLIGTISAFSYDNSETYGDATAYAEVVGMYPQCLGTTSGNYCAGDYYVDVSYTGDKFYMGKGYTYFPDTNSGDENGINGIPQDSAGRKYLASDGNGHPETYIICAWDRHDASNGDWAWVWQCGGWTQGIFPELTIVECIKDSDCSIYGSGLVCNDNMKCGEEIINNIELDTLEIKINEDTLVGLLTWDGGTFPYTVEIENFGDGESLYQPNLNYGFLGFNHKYATSGIYELNYCIYDDDPSSNNYCGTETIEIVSSCIPKTCEELGKDCGVWSDGCEGNIDCGECNPLVCNDLWQQKKISTDSSGNEVEQCALSSLAWIVMFGVLGFLILIIVVVSIIMRRK